MVEVSKCRKASLHFKDDAFEKGTMRELERLTAELAPQLVGSPARIGVILNQRVNEELYPAGSATHGEFVGRKLTEWYESSYCQSLKSR